MSNLAASTVILVDDAQELRMLYNIFFDMHSDEFEVIAQCSNGEDAIKMAEQLHPDFMLLDVIMPGMGGIEALPQIKKISPQTCVFMLSGFDADGMDQDPHQLGAEAVIPKGCDPERIINKLREHRLATLR